MPSAYANLRKLHEPSLEAQADGVAEVHAQAHAEAEAHGAQTAPRA